MEKAIDELLEQTMPVIYIPNESSDRTLIDVIYEKQDGYYVLWFHWPRDGDLTKREDYEPVIFIIKEGVLVDIGVRPHYGFNHSIKWQLEEGRPVILFTTNWHGPSIPRSRIEDVFKSSLFSTKLTSYPLREGTPPEWFKTAGMKKSVYDYAEDLIKGV